ncbi:MAG: 3D domain-containing protein [Acidobacteriota bacterium]|jgi:N-acetylmuramoyl-L-alanine amidase
MRRKTVFASAGVMVIALVVASTVSYTSIRPIATPSSPAIDETSSDTNSAAEAQAPQEEAPDYQVFEATAYCDFGITHSGLLARRGMVAADPQILPIGSVIQVEAGNYSGIYTVMDTGGVVKGRLIDIYMPDHEEAIQFGRQKIRIHVLRRGWHPDAAPEFEYALAG